MGNRCVARFNVASSKATIRRFAHTCAGSRRLTAASFQEIREPLPRGGAVFCLLQLRENPFDGAHVAGDGGRN